MRGAAHRPARSQGRTATLSAVAAVGLSIVGALNAEEIQRYSPLDLTLAVMLLGGCCFAYSLVHRTWSKGTTIGLYVAATWVPAALMTHMNPFGSEKTTQLFTIGLLSFLLGCHFGPSDAFLARVARFSVVVGLSVAAAMFLIGTPGSQGRLAIFDLNPIGLGRITGLAAVLLLLGLREQSPTWKGIRVALALFAAYITFQTQSQGPFAAIWLAVALGLFLKRERRAASTLVALGGAATLMLFSDVITRRITATAATDTSSLDRFELYKASWRIFTEHPAGIGWGNLFNYLPSSARVPALGIEQHSHNIVLEIAVEGGIIALSGFLLVVAFGFAGVAAHVSETGDQRYVGMWVYALAIAMTSGNLPGNRFTLLMLGIGVALYANRRSSVDDADSPRPTAQRPRARRPGVRPTSARRQPARQPWQS